MPVNDFEHLQSVIRKLHNTIVQEDFKSDIPDDGISTPEASLKRACLIKDNDTADMVQLRMTLFYTIREWSKRNHPEMYAFPVDDFQRSVVFKPQVVLTFLEERASAKRNNRDPIRRRASFRLMEKTSETITSNDVKAIGNRIKNNFPSDYRFKCGRKKVSYRDKPKGLELITSPYTDSEGKDFVERLLRAADVTPEWEKISYSKTERNYSLVEHKTILGERTRLPQARPIAEVYLREAWLHIHGRTRSLLLLSRPVK